MNDLNTAPPTAKNFVDMTGKVFGQLTVQEYAGKRGKHAYWECTCTCGNTSIVKGSHLREGRTKSCGCQQSAHQKKHGMYKTPEYAVWQAMIQRCINPLNANYPNYGGRCITICEEWRHDFSKFISDMGQRPTPHYSIDRIDPNGNYEPSNCRWATTKEQSLNKRSNLMITCGGETKTLDEWAEITGINRYTIRNRIFRSGWTPEQAIVR